MGRGTGLFVILYALLMPLGLAALALWAPLAKVLIGPAAGNIAAWVQAVGSIGAIIGTWAIAQDQARRERDLRAEQRAAEATAETQRRLDESERMSNSALGLGELALYRLHTSRAALEGEAPDIGLMQSVTGSIRHDADRIASFKVEALADGKAMILFSSFGGLLDYIANLLTGVANQMLVVPPEERVKLRAAALTNLETAIETMDARGKELKAHLLSRQSGPTPAEASDQM